MNRWFEILLWDNYAKDWSVSFSHISALQKSLSLPPECSPSLKIESFMGCPQGQQKRVYAHWAEAKERRVFGSQGQDASRSPHRLRDRCLQSGRGGGGKRREDGADRPHPQQGASFEPTGNSLDAEWPPSGPSRCFLVDNALPMTQLSSGWYEWDWKGTRRI